MGFSSHDDFISEVTVNGKFRRIDWNKLTHAVTAEVAGQWYCYAHSLGNPTAMTLGVVGTNLAWHPACDRSTGAIFHGLDVSPDTKHAINASAVSAAATSIPATLLLVDMLGWYPVNTVTTTGDQALINSKTCTANPATDEITLAATWDAQNYTAVQFTTTNTLPAPLALATTYYLLRTGAGTARVCTSRANVAAGSYLDLTDAGVGVHTCTMTLIDRTPTEGAGVQAILTPSTVLGAGTPNIQLTYTNSDGTGSRITPATLPISAASAPVGLIEYSGTGAGKYGPFMPMMGGDAGIRKVDQFNYNVTHTSGVTNVVLVRPIYSLQLTTLGVASERDLVNQCPSFPRIYDGACLVWLKLAGAATPVSTPYYGHTDVAWG